ncbi:MAG TPA: ester cyclase [Bryobacteraceae bacterium]|nr:ester cyclase [Bryobacteraceae bacterium]
MGALEDQNTSVVQQLGEALNGHRLDLLDRLVAPDFVRHCQATPAVQVRSLDDFKRFLQEEWVGTPDGESKVRFIVAQREFVALYWTYAGTQRGPWGPFPASDRRFEVDVSGIFRLEHAKVTELWVTWDNLAVLRQLGHLSLPAAKA